jgi:hypothetical protein
MFCPNCKIEYVRGVRECSDCGVPLVEQLPAGDSSSAVADPEAMEILWSGTDRRIAGALATALDRADLEYSDVAVRLTLLPASPGTVRKISVRNGDRAAAERILQDLVDGTPPQPNEAARDSAVVNPWRLNRRVLGRASEDESSLDVDYRLPDSGSADAPTPDDVVEDFEADEATCEVWVGEDRRLATYLDDCLRGVGIGCVVKREGTKSLVLVLPNAETRAREIVREVVEGAPPE